MKFLTKSLPYFSFLLVFLVNGVFQLETSIQTSLAFVVNTDDDTQDANPGDGICIDIMGNCSLRAAIEESNSFPGKNTIELPANIYSLANGEVQITDDLTIDGAGESTTVVSGQNTNRVFLVDKPGGNDQIQVFINKVSIVSGYVSGSGGGVWNDETLIIGYSSIKNNLAGESGGGIYNEWGELILLNSNVSFNAVDDASYTAGGGGIANVDGITILIDSEVIDNSCTTIDTSIIGGGGIVSQRGALVLVASTIRNNNVTTSSDRATGGGIYIADSELTILESRIDHNSAIGEGWGDGGGISIFTGEVFIYKSSVNENISSVSGGGISNSGNLEIVESTIDGNNSIRGGGIDSSASDEKLIIRNSSISGNNITGQGGGIYLLYGGMAVIGSTVSNNTNDDVGSGFMVHSGGVLTITNSTISENSLFTLGSVNISHSTITDTIHEGIHVESGPFYIKNTILVASCSGLITSYGNNLINNPVSCSIAPAAGDIVGQNARLASLDDYGGNIKTHALQADSPAIDTGTCFDLDGNLVSTDQRGASRRGSCDIGAYEYGGTITTITPSANPASLRETVVFTATVVRGEPDIPTGNVAIYDQNNLIDIAMVNNSAQAVLAVNDLSGGTHLITAIYSGDHLFAPSTSDILTQLIVAKIYLPIIN